MLLLTKLTVGKILLGFLFVFLLFLKVQAQCHYGRYGTDCRGGCHCKDLRYCRSSCTCADGWMGYGCNEACPHGRNGTDCRDGCHCKYLQYCTSSSSCTCADGWTGEGCSEACPHGRYGTSCRDGCHCKYLQYCTSSSSCTCADGWTGEGCSEECPFGRFGFNCEKTCHCADNSNCNKRDGQCLDGKCEPGYGGDNCQTQCPYRRSGDGCKQSCNCYRTSECTSASCTCADRRSRNGCNEACPHGRNGTSCTVGCHCKYSINCPYTSCTCADGWNGEGCNEECPFAKYGSNCEKTCHCADNSKCNKVNGRCPDGKCKHGYAGYYCQTQCPYRRSGDGCKESCNCYRTSECTSASCTCADGWMGNGCNEQCPFGKFGYNCQKTCHCVDNSKCNKTDGRCLDGKCEPGYAGDDCQTSCPHGRNGNGCRDECHCYHTSQCIYKSCTCADGWIGYGCTEACPHGRNGTDCRDGCHCKYPSNCPYTSCTCADGWKGEGCNEACPYGRNGTSCRDGCHCKDAADCTSASCTCADGWMGNGCNEQCDTGTFGVGCQLKCHCADDLQCRHIDGKCLDGKCAIGYKGDNCQQVDLKLILTIALVPLLVIFIIIALVIGFRRRNSKKRNACVKETSGNNIPMETGILQKNNQEILRDGDILSEVVHSDAVVLTTYNFLSHVQQMKMKADPFSNEFSNLEKHVEYPCKTGKLVENICKNRCKAILPCDHSRVVLRSDGTSSPDYINASYINGRDNYIATQGPLEETIVDFWRMIWQEKCSTIVMLTEIMENGKLKCCVYWPNLNETDTHGEFHIQCVQENHSRVYIYRILTIKKHSMTEKRFVHHFQCTIWPDHGILEEPTSFIEFRNKVRFSPSSKPPFVVHCSVGDGRTGTYIALDILLEQLWKKPSIDIFSCVNELCQQRAFMVQNKSQYEFIYDVLAEEILTGFSEISVTSIPDEFKKLQTIKANGEKAMLKKQYEEFIFPLNQSYLTESYQEPIYTNVEENNVQGASCKNFQEPIFVDGFYMKNEFLLTPQPYQKNAEVFWKLIYEKRNSIIVMLDDTPKVTSVYWPQKIKSAKVYGSIKVELTNTAESETFFQKYFQVSSTKQDTLEPISVLQFQSKIWQRKQLPSPSDITELVQTVANSCGLRKQLLIHCNDGITKSSIFCVLCVMICKIKMNETVSILRLLRSMKKKTPQIVTDYEAYKFCWSVAEMLQDENSTYSYCYSPEISEIV